NEGMEYKLSKDRIVLGRNADCDITLDNEHVARFHAHLVRQGAGYLIENLYARNGTYVNGTRICGPVQLLDSDKVHIGDYVLIYKQSESAHIEKPIDGSPRSLDHNVLPDLTFERICDQPQVLVRRQLGPYLIREPIGAGGTGLAYRASNT